MLVVVLCQRGITKLAVPGFLRKAAFAAGPLDATIAAHIRPVKRQPLVALGVVDEPRLGPLPAV